MNERPDFMFIITILLTIQQNEHNHDATFGTKYE